MKVGQKDGVVVIEVESTTYPMRVEELTVHEAEHAIKNIRKAIDEIRAGNAQRIRHKFGEH